MNYTLIQLDAQEEYYSRVNLVCKISRSNSAVNYTLIQLDAQEEYYSLVHFTVHPRKEIMTKHY